MPSKRTIRALVIAWSSFLPAAVASVLFFATFDPVDLALSATFPMEISGMAGYALGFLFFWLLSASAAWMATFLLRSDV